MLLFRRKKHVKVKVWCFGEDDYNAMATDGELTVWNCCGTTKEAAEEMARYKLRKFQEEEEDAKLTQH